MLLLALSFFMASIGPTLSQTAPVQQPAPPAEAGAPPAAPPQPAPADTTPAEPSLADKLGTMIKESVDNMSSSLKGTQQQIQDMNKGTADTLTRLPVTGFANGRAICIRAENGAPDCRVASDKLCQEKGFKSGRSMEIQTTENCNPRVYLPGYQRKDGDCSTDNYVTRAACN
jgi:hypothetical protein